MTELNEKKARSQDTKVGIVTNNDRDTSAAPLSNPIGQVALRRQVTLALPFYEINLVSNILSND